jgi:hypothetical protein
MSCVSCEFAGGTRVLLHGKTGELVFKRNQDPGLPDPQGSDGQAKLGAQPDRWR